MRIFLLLGSIGGFLAVALGAFAAHGLKSQLDAAAMQTWQTSVQYLSFHSLALLAIAFISERLPAARISGWLMLAGIVLFCGSLFALSLSGIKMLGMITPLGGLCFLAGWLWLAWSLRRWG